MIFFIWFAIIGILYWIFTETLLPLVVWGKPLKDTPENIEWLQKYLNRCQLNMYNSNMLTDIRDFDDHFIAKRDFWFYTYSIQKKGLVCRWSKIHKMINEKHIELLLKPDPYKI